MKPVHKFKYKTKANVSNNVMWLTLSIFSISLAVMINTRPQYQVTRPRPPTTEL